MATTKDNTDAAAAAGVATPVSSLDDYKAAVDGAIKAPGTPFFGLSADFNDPDRGWTAQSNFSAVEPQNLPGQVFLPEQLPDPNVAIRAGLPPVIVPEHLVTEDEDHLQGPEPWEIGADPRDMRDAVRARVVKEHEEYLKAVEDARAAGVDVSDTATKKTAAKSTTSNTTS